MSSRQHSALLALSAEIRNQIYEYCLSGKDFQVTLNGGIAVPKRRKKDFFASLLQVSRQLYAETAVLPFKLNTFHAGSPETLSKWAATLPIAAR